MLFEITGNIRVAQSEKIETIPVLNQANFSYDDFFKNFMLQNKSCIIKHVTKEWGSSKLWIKGTDINFEYLRRQYGHMNVTVYNCQEKEFNSQKCCDTSFNTYIDYFESSAKSAEFWDRLDYLKNWHLKLNSNDNFYEVPIYFASDWLNEYCVNCLKDDYRFVYMGPKQTWTPFHADVFSSYSWSANIYGRKKWILFPPGEEQLFKDSLGNLPYDITEENLSLGPHLEVTQEPGDVIFVPSGWYHQVWNLDDTISVNHNWINGCNIKIMYDSLKSNLKSIEKEIEDCETMDDFQEHCQLMLSTLFGTDFYKFYDFLKYIALNRVGMVQGKMEKTLFHGHEIGNNHIVFDLNCIQTVLLEFIKDEVVHNLKYFDKVDVTPTKLLEMIENVLSE